MSELARAATTALLTELRTTPKPGLVDSEHCGAHRDLCPRRFEASALALEATFAELAQTARAAPPTVALREELGAIGRRGERAMLRATGGSNTHRGALWALGLLVASRSSLPPRETDPRAIAARAAAFARLPDRFAPRTATHGARAARCYGIGGATAEAGAGFPAVLTVALPRLRAGVAPADVLLALIASVDDSCVFHRGGPSAARFARLGAGAVLRAGGTATAAGRTALARLDAAFIARNISPGGCADLLAAGLFLHAATP
jgi:triphosphoribosyl-dephospho-CoA synthase